MYYTITDYYIRFLSKYTYIINNTNKIIILIFLLIHFISILVAPSQLVLLLSYQGEYYVTIIYNNVGQISEKRVIGKTTLKTTYYYYHDNIMSVR